MGQGNGKAAQEERYNGRTPKEHAVHAIGPGMLDDIDEVLKAADLPDEGSFDPRVWAKIIKKRGRQTEKRRVCTIICV